MLGKRTPDDPPDQLLGVGPGEYEEVRQGLGQLRNIGALDHGGRPKTDQSNLGEGSSQPFPWSHN